MTPKVAKQITAAVSGSRLDKSIEDLARFGGRSDGGVNRPALSAEDLAARAWLIERAQGLGCTVFTDACANLFIRRPGTRDLPPVMTGSHIDTQPSGGRYDGCYGVMAGLECLAALQDLGLNTLRPIEVAVWTNEEGTRFSPGAMGSSAFVQPQRLQTYAASKDSDGISVAQAIASHAQAFPALPLRARIDVHAFIELHIEQGPVLENAGAVLGAVSGIQGVRWYEIHCQGSAAHAGTTPMPARRDAMILALRSVEQISALAQSLAGDDLRLTFGRWQVQPNAINTVPSDVRFTVDFRNADSQVLAAFDARLAANLSEDCTVTSLFTHEPVHFNQHIVDTVSAACLYLDMPSLSLRSGAFHDAMYLAEHCPTGMIFVPSRDGISHNPHEFTSPEDIKSGTQALAWCLIELANQP